MPEARDPPPAGARTAPPQVVVGTAGHVDHGKSSLVRALTGTDPDRLPEEKLRGMTIELGFAFLAGAGHGSGVDLAFIDCPGHERFIHQMVAGAGSIDGCLLVIAADEGPRAQTREHLDILRLLGIAWGRVVLSKADLVDAARLDEVARAATALVADSPLALHAPLPVSVRSGAGLDELKAWLFTQAQARLQDATGEHARLPIDRVFTIAGHGTVVTGTLLSGGISVGDQLELYPGGAVRVRSLQVDRRAVDRVTRGQRTAINLAGIERAAVSRGAWLASPGSQLETRVADVRLQVLPIGLKHRQRVEVHHGTAAVPAEVYLLHGDSADAGTHDAQVRLGAPLYLRAHDRLVLRRPSPSANLAGGTVVDAAPPRHRRFDAATTAHFAAAFAEGGDKVVAHIDGLLPLPASGAALIAWAGGEGPAAALIQAASARLVSRRCGQTLWWWTTAGWADARARLSAALAGKLAGHPERCWWGADALYAELWPDMPGEVGDDLVAAAVASGAMLRRGSVVTAPQHIPPFPPTLLAEARRLLALYRTAGLQPPYDHPAIAAGSDGKRAERALAALRERGWLLRLSNLLHFHRQAATTLISAVVQSAGAGGIDLLHWFKQEHGLTRKHAFPLCDWLDTIAVTRWVGDQRVLADQSTLPVPGLGEALE